MYTTGNCAIKYGASSEKTSYSFLIECLIKTFSKQENNTVLIPGFLLFFIGLFFVIGMLKSSYQFWISEISLITSVKINWYNGEKYFFTDESVKINWFNSEIYLFHRWISGNLTVSVLERIKSSYKHSIQNMACLHKTQKLPPLYLFQFSFNWKEFWRLTYNTT